MNLANFLTCSRAALSLVFALFLFSENPFGKLLALFVFVIAGLTDFWDGYVAREFGQTSQFGKLMDPIADKMLTLSAFFSFWALKLVPLWMVLLVVARDLIVTLTRFTMPPESRAQAVRSSGKHKTFLQILFIISVLIYLVAKEQPQWQSAWDANASLSIEFGMGLIVLVTAWTGFRVFSKNMSGFFKRS